MADVESVSLAKLPTYLGYQIRLAQTAVFRDIEAKMKRLGITPGEFSLLTIVQANPGINQKTLTNLYGLDKSTLSYAVNRLEKRKWVRRAKSPDDGRVFGLWLTKTGQQKVGLATTEIELQEDLMDTALKPGERTELLDMLMRISDALNKSS